MSFVERPIENFMKLRRLDPFMEGHKGFICGGCFKNIFNDEPVKDVDVFFESNIDYCKAIIHFKNNRNFSFLYESDNVKAFRHKDTKTVVELCSTIYGSPEEIMSQFDFTITKCAYFKKSVEVDGNTETHYTVLLHDAFFEHLHQKRLVLDDKIPFPMSTFERMLRYVRYGYIPCRETKIKLAQAINKLEEREIVVSNSLYGGMD